MTPPNQPATVTPTTASDTAAALNLEGVGQLLDGDPEAALAAFALALEGAPGNPAILNNLGNALAATGHAEEARAAWEAALAARPDDPRPWRHLGLLHQLAGDTAQAAAAYRNYLELCPDDGEAWHNLALVLHAAGHAAEGKAAFEIAAAALSPDDGPETALRLAEGHLLFGDPDAGPEAAEEALEAVLSADPHCERGLRLLALTLYRQGRDEEAREVEGLLRYEDESW